MFGIGFTELLLIAAIALLVLGPEKLPQAARTAGLWYGKLRRTLSSMQSDIEAELNLAEARKQMQEELAKIKDAEKNMHEQMQKMQQNIDNMQANTQQQIQTETDAVTASLATSDDNDTTDQEATHQETTHQDIAPENQTDAAPTLPLVEQFFLLSDYDKKRRLPSAPYLPNTQPDPLLHHPAVHANSPQQAHESSL